MSCGLDCFEAGVIMSLCDCQNDGPLPLCHVDDDWQVGQAFEA